MEIRYNFHKRGKAGKDTLGDLHAPGKYLSRSIVEKSLLGLVEFCISQINRGAFCLNMHARDPRSAGETELEYAQNIRALVDVIGIDHVCIITDTKLTPA